MEPGPASIAFRGLISARWVLIALIGLGHVGLSALSAAGIDTSGFPTPTGSFGWLALGGLLTAWTAFNIVSLARRESIASGGLDAVGATLLVDTFALTVVFALAGGASNPFTALYFVPITLATQVSPRWTWVVGVASAAAFGALFVLGDATASMAPGDMGAASHAGHASHHAGHGHAGAGGEGDAEQGGGHFAGHLKGMWIAFAASGLLITVFVHRIAVDVQRQRDELARLRGARLEDRHLAALGTLAAGAAHELGTPLGTIALLAEGMVDMDRDERAEAVDDLLSAVARCKRIVHEMASPELRASVLGQETDPWPASSLEDALEVGRADRDAQLVWQLDPSAATTRLEIPREAVTRVLRELIKNAETANARAGAVGGRVVVALRAVGGASLEIRVQDEGPGLTESERLRAFEPFFTTAPEGQGLGLGLYLARAQARQLDGELRLEASERGVAAVLCLPLSVRSNEHE